MELLATSIDGLQLGLCFSILALGVYFSYSVLDFPDLSVDGTFPLGAVCCSILLLKTGIPSVIVTLLTFFVGAAVGFMTGVLHVKCGISKLLSGIITMTALLSVTLALTKILSGTGYTVTNFSYRSQNVKGIFGADLFSSLSAWQKDAVKIVILLLFVAFFKIISDLLMSTKLGYLIKATGKNETLIATLGRDSGKFKLIGLCISNGFVAVSGAVYSQLFMSYDNTCGSGKVVVALSSVIIGLAIFSKVRFLKDTTAVIFGAMIYSLCLNYFSLIDKDGIYLKILNALAFALILIFNDKLSLFGNKNKEKQKETENA